MFLPQINLRNFSWLLSHRIRVLTAIAPICEGNYSLESYAGMAIGPTAKKLESQEGAWICALSATQAFYLGPASRLLSEFLHLEARQKEEAVVGSGTELF